MQSHTGHPGIRATLHGHPRPSPTLMFRRLRDSLVTPAFWLCLNVLALTLLGAYVLPFAIAKAPGHGLASLDPFRASATMIVTIGLSALTSRRMPNVEALRCLLPWHWFLWSIALVMVPYLTSWSSNDGTGSARPGWHLGFLPDATPSATASLLAAIGLLAAAAALVSRALPAPSAVDDGDEEVPAVTTAGLAFAGALAIWTIVMVKLGKDHLTALLAVAIAGAFILRATTAIRPQGSRAYTGLVVAGGYLAGVLASTIWTMVLYSWGLLAAALAVSALFSFQASGTSFTWRDAAKASLGVAIRIAGLALLVAVVLALWVIVKTAMDVAVGHADLPYRWEQTLMKIGLLSRHDGFGVGFSAMQARTTLVAAGWLGSNHIVPLPRAWDDFALLTLVERYGWWAGLCATALVAGFLLQSLAGIRALAKGMHRTLALMLWTFLAVTCAINLQANLGILPGIPYLGLPFLSYHWFLASLGGIVAGLALRGFADADAARPGAPAPRDLPL